MKKSCRFKSKYYHTWYKGVVIGEKQGWFKKYYLVNYLLRFTDLGEKNYTEYTELIPAKDVVFLD